MLFCSDAPQYFTSDSYENMNVNIFSSGHSSQIIVYCLFSPCISILLNDKLH